MVILLYVSLRAIRHLEHLNKPVVVTFIYIFQFFFCERISLDNCSSIQLYFISYLRNSTFYFYCELDL
jgi:hypothetical protein